MRYLVLMCLLCGTSWLTKTPEGSASEKFPQANTQELIVGKWEDPTSPGNSITFDRDGGFTADISAGVIRAHPGGTYRVLEDGSLEVQVRVGTQVAPPRKMKVKVTRDTLTLTDEQHRETRFKRVK